MNGQSPTAKIIVVDQLQRNEFKVLFVLKACHLLITK